MMLRNTQLKRSLIGGAALVPCLLAIPAWGQTVDDQIILQDEADNSAGTNDIVVTGSRVKRDGYNAPTPETVLSADDIERASPVNIADFVNDLPQAAASSTPRTATVNASSGSAGSNFLNLRGLGANRTLVLLDGRRFVSASLDGLVDINTLPSALISRVDVVTGGASAAYGSDAVAGVVNFVLDTRFDGLKGSIQSGVTQYGDGFDWKAEIAGGMPFAGGRGHVVASATYADSEGVLESASRPWFDGQKFVPNPAFSPGSNQPQLIPAQDAGSSVATYGGLITNGVLRGTRFGQGGSYSQLNYGTQTGAFAVGGDGDDLAATYALELPVRQFTAFGRISYDVSDAMKLFAEAAYADAFVRGASPPTTVFQGNLVLRADNAFLPQELRNTLAAAGQSTFNFGSFVGDLGRLRPENQRRVQRYAAGIEGDFGSSWSYNLYGQYGQTRVSVDALPNVIVPNFRAATDAVRNAAGNIVCRVNQVSVTNPACVPFNPFGLGVNTPEAVSFVSGNSQQRLKLEQTVVAGTVQGEPFDTWAGPVSIAFGAEYRKEQVTGSSDPLSQANAFGAGNYKPTNGSYDVKEAFGEVVVPLARDVPFLRLLDLNGAFRRTDYSISGAVSTWKLGATWEPISGVRVRATRSRDIRAPNLNDLFLGGVVSAGQTVLDRATGLQTANIVSTLVGSQALVPEIANTTTAGIVLQPQFAPGLSLSFDYYRIRIEDSIVTLTNQQIVDLCAAGTTSLCDVITRNSAGTITAIRRSPTNIARETLKGFDIEGSYRVDLADWADGWNASLTLRALATRIITRSIDNGLLVDETAGENNGPLPDWRVVTSLTYQQGGFTGIVTARSVSDGVYDQAFTAANIANNNIPGATYVDLGLAYEIPAGSGTAEVFFNVENLFNKDPVIVYPINQQFILAPVNAALYDTLGREFRVGVRVRL